MLGELDQFIRQQLQRPTGAACGRGRAGRRHQQGFLFTGELAVHSRARLFGERRLQIAEHEAALCPVHGGPAHANVPRNLLLAGSGVGCQQYLRALELARRMLAAAHKCREFSALGLAEFNPVAYIHPRLH